MALVKKCRCGSCSEAKRGDVDRFIYFVVRIYVSCLLGRDFCTSPHGATPSFLHILQHHLEMTSQYVDVWRDHEHDRQCHHYNADDPYRDIRGFFVNLLDAKEGHNLPRPCCRFLVLRHEYGHFLSSRCRINGKQLVVKLDTTITTKEDILLHRDEFEMEMRVMFIKKPHESITNIKCICI